MNQIVKVENIWKPKGAVYENLAVGRPGGQMFFIAGQIPFDSDGNIVEGDIVAQTDQVVRNIRDALGAGGASLDDVVKVTIYTTDIARNLEGIRSVIRKYGLDDRPGTLVQIVRLVPEKAMVEIEAIAVK